MSSLHATRQELLGLYPHALSRLDVAVPVSDADKLVLTYVQRDTPDSGREWVAYERWRKRTAIDDTDAEQLEQLNSADMPPIDEVYVWNMPFIRTGLINPSDKILLHVIMKASGNCAELDYIHRNADPLLKGTAREFYPRLAAWLRSRGYRYCMASPVPGLEDYWAQQGMVPDESRFRSYVHAL